MNLLKDIKEYWDERSTSFSKYNNTELKDFKKDAYEEIFQLNLADVKDKKGLDIGCGPGFFSIILANLGANMFSIDYSTSMLKQSKENFAKHLRPGISSPLTQRMDAQKLDFNNEAFDFIVTRNLTWNLQNPDIAYTEWLRVLKPGGTMLIFDAQWYGYLYDKKIKELMEENVQALIKNGFEDLINSYSYYKADVMENIAKDLFFSKVKRPAWDINFFQDLGLRVIVDLNLQDRLFSPIEKILYQYSPLFLIKVSK